MLEITVTVVDHTASTNLGPLIKRHLEDIFLDLLHTETGNSSVVVQWRTTSPAASEQNLVLHFVNDIAGSYVSQQMPGDPINPQDGGVTRPRSDRTGSEFYKFPAGAARGLTATGYAKLAVHEAMHNVTRLANGPLHAQGGVGGSPPQLPVNDANRRSFQSGLGNVPAQLL